MKHVWLKAFGLTSCEACKCSPRTATTDCLGTPLSDWQIEQIEAGILDRVGNHWMALEKPEKPKPVIVDPQKELPFEVIDGERPMVATIVPKAAFNAFAQDFGTMIARLFPRISDEDLTEIRRCVRAHFKPSVI